MIVTNEPQNQTYQDLLDLAFEICDEFILVVGPHAVINDNARLLLSKLETSLIKIQKQNEWPGTLTWGPPAKVYYYGVNEESKKIIKEAANSLYSWIPPDLPDDLTFYKQGKPWLTNTAHEEQSSIETEDEQEIRRVLAIKGLNIEL
jgi:hypothetical protein